MKYTERVNGFQITDPTYLGRPPKDTPIRYDIVKWVKYPEPVKAVVIEEGKSKGIQEVSEYCYVVGQLEWDKKDGGFDFRSIGMRWLEAKPDEAVVQMVLDFADQIGKQLSEEEDY